MIKNSIIKTSVFVLTAIFSSAHLYAQTDNVGIGTITPDPAALLDLSSTESQLNGNPPKGLLLPSTSSAGLQNMINDYGGALPDGLLVYNSDSGIFKYFKHDAPFQTTPPYTGGWETLTTTAPSSNSNIPVGGIIMWSGTTGSIPSGWALCNGSLGTPDLTDRFIVSIANSSENPQPSEQLNALDFVSVDVQDANNRRFYKMAFIMKQ